MFRAWDTFNLCIQTMQISVNTVNRYAMLALLAMALPARGQSALDSLRAGQPAIMDGSVHVTGGIAAIGIGYLWGHGTLDYQGQTVSFKVRGLDLGDVAAVHLKSEGPVYHLTCLRDFAGTYTAVSTGAAVAVGQSAAVMQNEHGVVIELESKVVGLRVNLAASRLQVRLIGKSNTCNKPASIAP